MRGYTGDTMVLVVFCAWLAYVFSVESRANGCDPSLAANYSNLTQGQCVSRKGVKNDTEEGSYSCRTDAICIPASWEGTWLVDGWPLPFGVYFKSSNSSPPLFSMTFNQTQPTTTPPTINATDYTVDPTSGRLIVSSNATTSVYVTCELKICRQTDDYGPTAPRRRTKKRTTTVPPTTTSHTTLSSTHSTTKKPITTRRTTESPIVNHTSPMPTSSRVNVSVDSNTDDETTGSMERQKRSNMIAIVMFVCFSSGACVLLVGLAYYYGLFDDTRSQAPGHGSEPRTGESEPLRPPADASANNSTYLSPPTPAVSM
ncbi:m07 protein [Murid betaherpesvirus 1]|uniref:M07 protein n=2 Tax=Murid herpesvirus 1 TaxID=10366 RepID=H2A164_MUHV1|nr:m07 [Muromegalovirus C4A]CCE56679.1 m07 protein [Murid betaherpesvirus 1]